MRFIYCFTFFICSTAFSQSEIDATNVSVLKFYIPNRSYQRNKVKEVLVHFGVLSNKKELVQHSFYNKDGYLEYQKIYNNNFPSDEESIIVRRNGGSFEVTRKIRKTALLNSSACLDCFWGTYYSIKNYWEADMDSLITVKSIYNFAKDSSFNYQSFINQERLDSGHMVTKFSLDHLDREERINAYKDSFFLRDTLVIRDSQKIISNAVQTVTSRFFVNKLLAKTETNRYINNALDGTFYVLYQYNLNGKLTTEEEFGLNGQIFKKRFFYYKNGIIDYYSEKIYRSDGTLDFSKKFDRNGKILEEAYHGGGDKIFHKTIYKYFPNGLLSKKFFMSDGIVKSGYTYRYVYK